MFSLSSITKSVIILHAEPAYEGVYLGIDTELEALLKDTLQKNNVVIKDTINQKHTFDEKVEEMDNVLSSLVYPEDTALRCIILMLR